MVDSLRETALRLPQQPGVYIMKDAKGEVIYVGKAKKLKNRVTSYFHGEHNLKTEAMISKIADFDVIIANSELEALVLENSLIKRHMPRYNILLKDDKGYPFIRLDMREEYPTFSVVSRVKDDGARYFGPYGSRGTTRSAVESICKAFKLPTCGKKFPRDIGKTRPCLNHHLGACRGWCLKDSDNEEYREAVAMAALALEGKTDDIAAKLQQEMEAAAERLQFELAAEKRDRLRAVTALKTKQRVVAGAMADTDAVGFWRGDARCCFTVMHYMDGDLIDKDYELLELPFEEDGDVISGLLRQYYERRGVTPQTVYLPCELPDGEALEQFLAGLSGRKVRLLSPQRGEKARIVETAELNAREEAERATTREERTTRTLEWLQRALDLPAPPNRIEAYDISNTGADSIVAGMTVFVSGRPLKRDYRKFRIRTTETPDDYQSMFEVVSRRARHYLDGDQKFSSLPDVMFIDGGAGQVRAAQEALAGAGLTVPVFGMVKDDRHRTRALVTGDGREIGLSAQPAVFAFVGTVQEETHRFAIEYHRSLRGKRVRTSSLEKIEGVGEKRRAALLKRFGSIQAVRSAEPEALAEVLPSNVARSVYDYFHSEGGEEDESDRRGGKGT
ncbi:MAG: excinuclease ABC subunit UvrC [Oscillospiraceae bacterium]|nr:excinuclease ABC subunit UvrC [Oscillospiraceae bacterium]